jgi:hypothetical protein
VSGGWVKLYRILLDKPIWRQSTPEQKVILITLLLMANHEPCEWEWRGKKFVVQPGQFVTSLPAIQERCGKGISIQNIRTALARFQKLEFLTDEASETGRLINILNWAEYQGLNGEGNSLPNRLNWDNQQSTNRRVTANKNDKNDKNQEEGSIYTPSFESFWKVYPRKVEKKAAFQKWKARIKQYDPDTLIQAATAYAEKCRREGTPVNYVKHPATFLGPNEPFKDYLTGGSDNGEPKEHLREDKPASRGDSDRAPGIHPPRDYRSRFGRWLAQDEISEDGTNDQDGSRNR